MRRPKRTRSGILILSSLFALVWALVGATSATSATGPSKVVERPVTFQVRNVDRSLLSCPSDGAAYEVKGHLVGPASEVGPGASGEHRAVTLYLHGFSFGEFFWNQA